MRVFLFFNGYKDSAKTEVMIVLKKQKLSDLILKAQGGDKDALNQVVERFKPIINKYAYRLGSEDVSSEIVEWIINATMRYKGKNSWGREELEKFLHVDNNNT